MMRQYFDAKERHPGVLLAMRVGDFYEFYGEDAVIASNELQITLTARDDGGSRVSMAGVPFHSVEKYLARLLQKGLKVALCDQLEDPKHAKGLVKRGVTRVLTPGTVLEDSMVSAGHNNFLAALCISDGVAGLATLEPTTGEFSVTEFEGEQLQSMLLQELSRLRPSELLVGSGSEAIGNLASEGLGSLVTPVDPSPADRARSKLLGQFEVANLRAFGCEGKHSAIVAASMILGYAEKNGLALSHVNSLSTYSVDSFMQLDPATRRSLELTRNLSDGSDNLTLRSVFKSNVTPMGGRLITSWIDQPLLDVPAIKARQDAVERFMAHALARGDLRDGLKAIRDLPRLTTRCSEQQASPRDAGALRTTLLALPMIAEPLRKLGVGRIQELREQIGDHSELARYLDRAIAPEPPHSIRDGGFIKQGHDIELDKLRELARDGKSFIAGLEAKERETSGISTLKVGFNSVFGYYLEVPKSQIDKVPNSYIRKQTTANAERYITAELKEQESLVLGAQDKAKCLEAELFEQVLTRVGAHAIELLKTARAVAELDALSTFAETASARGYVKPELVESDAIDVVGGRHPVVETTTSGFVPNDLSLEDGSVRCMVLTGPNMSGKSTYLRQNALIALMAQIGSFVPAKQCRLGICDRIFARIGAKDELALGQSTFMVEMVESANILIHSSSRSLVILDEVGRGTSTFDGLAIAWAMTERLAEIGAKTLFATHYHQLNQLADQVDGIANFRVAVEEFGDDIVWTHKVLPGGTDRSYGIHVAKMAGVPPSVLKRATSILAELEEKDTGPAAIPVQKLQLTLFEIDEPPFVKELKLMDLDDMTPRQALAVLDDWKRRFAVQPAGRD